jgi:hypothetical protein
MRQNYINGIVTGAAVTATLFLFPMIFGPSETMKNTTLQFKVVQQYNGCNVVRFKPLDATSGFQYFLDCSSIK